MGDFMTFVAGFLFLAGLAVLISAIFPLIKDIKAKKKKASPTGILRIGAGIAVLIMAVIIMPSDSSEVAEEKPEVAQATSTTEAVSDEKEKGNAAPKVEKEKEKEEEQEEGEKEVDEPSYSDEAERGVKDYYIDVISESDGLVLNIDQEDDYNQIYVRLSDDFKLLSDELKQSLIDDWGNTIENNTRSRLFGTGSNDFLFVYFIDGKGEHLADTGHFDKGWTVK